MVDTTRQLGSEMLGHWDNFKLMNEEQPDLILLMRVHRHTHTHVQDSG